MRLGLMIGATLLGIGAAEAAEDALARYRWVSRVLVLSAPDAADPNLAAQRAILAKAAPGVRERDLVTLEAIGDTPEAHRLRGALGLPGRTFRVVLVGKDGGAKRTDSSPLAAGALFDTIDAMPMRRDERRR